MRLNVSCVSLPNMTCELNGCSMASHAKFVYLLYLNLQKVMLAFCVRYLSAAPRAINWVRAPPWLADTAEQDMLAFIVVEKNRSSDEGPEWTHHPQKAGYRAQYGHRAFAQVRGQFDAVGRSLRDRNLDHTHACVTYRHPRAGRKGSLDVRAPGRTAAGPMPI